MDRERLTELLQDPSHVAKQDLSALLSMADRFPWFSGARLLLAVGEHETGEVLTNHSNGSPAAFLPSRSVLFDLVRAEELQQPAPMHVVRQSVPFPTEPLPEMPPSPASSWFAPSVTESIVAPTATAPPAAPQPTIPEVPCITLGPVPTVPVEENLRPEPASAIDHLADKAVSEPLSLAASETLTTGPAPILETPAFPRTAAPEEDLLDRQIHEAVRASGYDLGTFEMAPSVPPEPPPLHVPERVAEPKEEPLAQVGAILLPIAQPVPPVQSARGTRLRFTDWLGQSEIPASASAMPESAPSRPSAPVVPEEDAAPPPVAPLPTGFSPKEIMEQFIQRSNPAPIAAKATFFNPQQAAKRSLQDDGLVSETLARIHEKQGNFAKAKEVYDRLAVKHPEKSVYFAALSKALEGRMHK